MGKIFITSDLHFDHDRDCIWGARGYTSVEEMNKEQLRKFPMEKEEKMKTVLVVPTSPQCEWTMSQTVYLKWLKINFRVRIFL